MALTSEQEAIFIKIQLDVKAALDKLREFFAAVQDYKKRIDAFNDAMSGLMTKHKLSYETATGELRKMNAETEKLGKGSLFAGMAQTTFASDAKKAFVSTAESMQGATVAAAKQTAGLGFLGTTAAFVFGTVFGVTVIGALKKVISTIKEAMQAGVDYLKVIYRMEVAAYALQKSGQQIDFKKLIIQAEALQKAFPLFSKQKAMESVAYISLLTREFGFAEKQIGEVIKASAVLAVIMGKDVNEAAREVALTLSSGYSESLQRAGLNINRVIIQQEALRMGYKEGYQWLSGEVKAQAGLNVVMRQLDPLYDKALEYYKTIPGEVDTATAAWQNYMTVLGASLAPFKSAWAVFWTDILNIAIEGTQKMQVYQLMPLFDIMMEKTKYGFAKSIEEMEQDLENFRKAAIQLFPTGIPEGDFAEWIVETYGQEFLDTINAAAFATGEFAKAWESSRRIAEKMPIVLGLTAQQLDELKKKFDAADLILYVNTEEGQKALAEFDKKTVATRQNLVEQLGALGIDIDTGKGKQELDEFDAKAAETRRLFSLKTEMRVDTEEGEQAIADFENYVKSLFPDGITLEAKTQLLIRGVPLDIIAQIERIVGVIEIPVRILPKVDVSGLTSIMKGFMQQVAGLAGGGGGGGDRAGDFRIQQRRALEDYNRSILEEEQKFNERLEKENARYRNNEIEAEQRHQEKMLQLRERFLFDLEDALHERDARQVLRLIRQYKLEKTQAERDYEERKAERARQFEEAKAMIREEHEERLRLMEEEFELRRQREEEDYKRRSATGAGQSKKELEALKKAWDDKIRAMAAAKAEELGLDTTQAYELEKLYLEYYGSDGKLASLSEDSYIAQAYWAARALAEIQALIEAYARLPTGILPKPPKPPSPEYIPEAKGGLSLVTRPTLFEAGEAGPELAMFIPLNKLMGGLPSFGGGSAPSSIGGKIEVAVRLSDGLEAEIINQSLNEVAAVIRRTQRSK